MSLFDAVLRDGVLNPPVMQQNYYIAIRSDEAFGSGTFDDPWNGSTQTFFDAAMSLVPENSTVFLGPCTFTSSGSPDKVFETKGFPTAGGFRVKSGQRIVGSGMETTIVRLKDHSAGAPNHVFGMPLDDADEFLYGFELTDLTCDANLPAASGSNYYQAGGINITGRHVFIQRVKVKNYGSNDSGQICRAISGCTANEHNPVVPFDVVLADCVADEPSVNHSETAIAFSLQGVPDGTVMSYHEACVLRDCYVNGGWTSGWTSTKRVVGCAVVGGRGTIVENNRFLNCTVGGPFQDATLPGHSEDVMVRDNFYHGCKEAVSVIPYDTGSAATWTVKRMILEGNAIDLANLGSARGLFFTAGTTPPDKVFEVLILRGNRIRGLNGIPPASGATGIEARYAERLTVDQNFVEPEEPGAITAGECGKVTALNNRKLTGELVRVLNDDTGLHVPELMTEAENLIYTL